MGRAPHGVAGAALASLRGGGGGDRPSWYEGTYDGPSGAGLPRSDPSDPLPQGPMSQDDRVRRLSRAVRAAHETATPARAGSVATSRGERNVNAIASAPSPMPTEPT